MTYRPHGSCPATSSPAISSPATSSPALSHCQSVFVIQNDNGRATYQGGLWYATTWRSDLANGLSQQIPNCRFISDMEFSVIKDTLKSGVKPSCDGAVDALLTDRSPANGLEPLLLYEYKLVVDPRCNSVDCHDLMEVAIQGYYCLYQHKVHAVVHCLQ